MLRSNKLIQYLDRETKKIETENVYGEKAIAFLYGDRWFQKFFTIFVAKFPLFSALYGLWQKAPWTKHKVKKFIDRFGVDPEEFEKKVSEFSSFNDFFIRRLKSSSRPLANEELIIPADGRYFFYPNIDETSGFIVKNQKFSLTSLVQDDALARRYAGGGLVIGRLCPVDYHRFHFPCEGIPAKSRRINGYWYSVNPVAVKKNLSIMTQNKRSVCELDTESLGKVLLIEVGATNVGSIIQTYQPGSLVKKGDEKGYFSFGASALIMLFEPGVMEFSEDLMQQNHEIRCLMGQPMAHKKR